MTSDLQVWCEDWDEGVYTDAQVEPVGRLDGVRLVSGERLGGRFPQGMRLVLAARREPSDFTYAGPAFIVSGELRGVIERCGGQVEYFQLATTLNGKSLKAKQYYFANLLSVVECFDWEKSAYRELKGRALDIERLAIRKAAVSRLALFRVNRTIPSIVLASSALAAAIRESGCTGVRFGEVESWRDPSLFSDGRDRV